MYIMNKFDIVEKINFTDLIRANFTHPGSPYNILINYNIAPESFIDNYFNWGRNALYYLFKSLPFSYITFPAFTCPTLTEAAEKAGKKIILTEVDLNTFNIDINKVPKDTECLVVVHTFGNPVNIKEIRNKFNQLLIIEDCAHSLFAKINNQFVGSRGDIILFSFYKQIANINGALLLTKSKLLNYQNTESDYKYLKRIIYKTKGWHQWIVNYKRHDYLPQIEPHGISKNKPSKLVFKLFSSGFIKLESEIEKRRRVAKWHDEQVNKSVYFMHQWQTKNSLVSYYQYALRLKPEYCYIRDKLGFNLRQKNIFIGRLWYDAPIVQDRYKKYQKSCPNALQLAKAVINLPIHSCYRKEDVEYLFNQLNKTIKDLLSNS